MGKDPRIKTAPSHKRPLLDSEVSSSLPGWHGSFSFQVFGAVSYGF